LADFLPKHIAIVMDGNGRWAQKRGLERIKGHQAGVEAVKVIIRSCAEKGICVLSLFAFSSENWSRPDNEVQFLMALFIESLNQELDELHQHGIRLMFTGERSNLSQPLIHAMSRAERLTKNNKGLCLNIVVNYGGKWDIIQATRMLAQKVKAGEISADDINENMFSNYLSTRGIPCPDLFIRTSGEKRISNFLLWQLAYSELYFCDEYWPDFNIESLEKAVAFYTKCERRFGLTSEQVTKEPYA
jgi:undecaprenyl diphosphate synthase